MNNNIDLVLFGAKGDLSERKLFPALYQLDRAGLLGDSVRVAGLARQDISSKEFIAEVEVNLKKNIPDYMVPSYIFKINKFPLNQNGKLDENKLKLIAKKKINEQR